MKGDEVAETEGMLDYKSTREQRSAARWAMGIVKLRASSVPAPEKIEVDYKKFCELARYADALNYICHSEKIIGTKD